MASHLRSKLPGLLATLGGGRALSAAAGGPGRKVAVLGAAGGIGQPLGLLMKARPAGWGGRGWEGGVG